MIQSLFNHSGVFMQAADSMVVLDPVVYGRQGAWAINLWFKASPGGLYGDQFEYLYSHSNANAQYLTGWEANQVCLQGSITKGFNSCAHAVIDKAKSLKETLAAEHGTGLF